MTSFGDVFRALGLESNDATAIDGVSASARPEPGTLTFMTLWSETNARLVDENPLTLFIAPQEASTLERPNVISVARPRLAYALVMRDLLIEVHGAGIASSAVVDATAAIGTGVFVGEFCVIEAGVVIGDGTRVDHHVVIKSGVEIGCDVRIGSHSSIGGAGFGFEVDEDGGPIRIGHRGGVVISDGVEIGHHCAIAQGTIDPTHIARNVKIDDCVFIAHNVSIGEASFVIAGAQISGSVKIGRRVWISPEAAVINKVTIGDDALVGLGAVVVADVESNTIVAGVPAKSRGPRYRIR